MCLSGCGCSMPRRGGSQPLFSCQGKASLGFSAYTAPPYPPSLLSHCLRLLGQGHVLHSVFTHLINSSQSTQRAEPNASASEECCRHPSNTGRRSDGRRFFMNRFMKESSVTALCLLVFADGQRACAFIDDTSTAKSNDGAGAG